MDSESNLEDSEEGAPLGSAQLSYLRNQLEEKRRELYRNVTRNGAVRTVRDDLSDPMDAATAETDEGDDLSLSEHERRLLEEVEHALRKMDGATYGVSEESGEPIPFARLKIIPWARLTIQEEEAAERERQNFARP